MLVKANYTAINTLKKCIIEVKKKSNLVLLPVEHFLFIHENMQRAMRVLLAV